MEHSAEFIAAELTGARGARAIFAADDGTILRGHLYIEEPTPIEVDDKSADKKGR